MHAQKEKSSTGSTKCQSTNPDADARIARKELSEAARDQRHEPDLDDFRTDEKLNEAAQDEQSRSEHHPRGANIELREAAQIPCRKRHDGQKPTAAFSVDDEVVVKPNHKFTYLKATILKVFRVGKIIKYCVDTEHGMATLCQHQMELASAAKARRSAARQRRSENRRFAIGDHVVIVDLPGWNGVMGTIARYEKVDSSHPEAATFEYLLKDLDFTHAESKIASETTASLCSNSDGECLGFFSQNDLDPVVMGNYSPRGTNATASRAAVAIMNRLPASAGAHIVYDGTLQSLSGLSSVNLMALLALPL